MIKEITRYYSDIDFAHQFYTKEKAENFERTYKPFYELNDEAELTWNDMRVHPDLYPDPIKVAKEYFNKAKESLNKYLIDNKIFYNQLENFKNIEYNKEDIAYVIDMFRDAGSDWYIISDLFDTIYCIMIEKI